MTSDSSEALSHLRSLRAAVTQERRKKAAEAIEMMELSSIGPIGYAADLKIIQELIDAVDRAIADEEASEPSVYESRGLRSL